MAESDERVPVDRAGIAATERLIRPHIRETPIIETDAAVCKAFRPKSAQRPAQTP